MLGKVGTRKPIPKPVALPSIRKENFGLDPSVNLIAASGGAGWGSPKGKTTLGSSPSAPRKEPDVRSHPLVLLHISPRVASC